MSATKFHLVVLQCNGEISSRQVCRFDDVKQHEVRRELIGDFNRILLEKLPQMWEGVVTFQVPFLEDGNGMLEWRQAEPFSGMPTMAIANKLKFTWFFFCGNEPKGEANTIRGNKRGRARFLYWSF